MKRRTEIIVAVIAAAVLLVSVVEIKLLLGTKPFKNMDASEISEVSLYLIPPDKTYELEPEEIEEMVELFHDLVVYQRDNSYEGIMGQTVEFTITKTDGSQTEVSSMNPWLVIDGIGYRAKYAPCEALNVFANGIDN